MPRLLSHRANYSDIKKILVIRNDRVGDVILSTPAFRALRHSFPGSFISVLVRPYTEELVQGNPDIDEVIVYDKQGQHNGLWQNLKFIRHLRQYNFDAVVVLNPSCRMHLITFLAGIKHRVGYSRKWGWLLTDRLDDEKYQGSKHEFEYALDMVRYFGGMVGRLVEVKDIRLFVPLGGEYSKNVDTYLEERGIINDDFVVVHPWASCPSKIWPRERFVDVCLRLKSEFGQEVIVVCGQNDLDRTEVLLKQMEAQGIKTHLFCRSLGQLAWLLSKSRLLVSNDSGPVHIATAVGTPVIAIFGRNLPGLGPKRWRPTGSEDIVFHKDIGCHPCLAHNCQKGFACLQAITVDEVMKGVRKILKKAKIKIDKKQVRFPHKNQASGQATIR